MSVVNYEGVLQGLERLESGQWVAFGKPLDTPATEEQVIETVTEALQEPGKDEVFAARVFMFGQHPGFQYTSQSLLALLVAYERECEGGDSVEPVAEILREAARKIAIIEALTV